MNYPITHPHLHVKVLLLMCLVLLGTTVHAQNQEARITLDIRNATLESFTRQLENATGFSFVYGEEVKLTQRITLKAVQLTISEILQRAFENEPIRFEISGKHILLQERALPQKPVSRKFTISGYVTDGASCETLIGANILESRHSTGTTTNPFGFYTLTLPEGTAEITCSYLGYGSMYSRFELNRDTLLNICLKTNNQLDEVVILSHKREAGIQSTAMGAHEIPMTQIQNTPSVFGEADLLKTIQLMPGVQAGMEGFSGIYVRGGGPDQNLIMLDGIPVYNADHLLGVFSIFTPEAVKKVTLFKSSFPARYGGRLSSIVDIRTNDGDMKKYHGTLSIGTLSSKLHLEGPIVKDRTSFLLSTRGTHLSLLPRLLSNSEESYGYYFYDLNAKVNHKFNDRNRLFLNLYHGKDYYHFGFKSQYEYAPEDTNSRIYQEDTNKSKIDWGNTIAAGRWNHVFNNKLFSNSTVAYNNYRMMMGGDSKTKHINSHGVYAYQYGVDYRSGISDWSFRTDFDYTPNPSHHIKFGMEYLYHTFRPETLNSKITEEENNQMVQDTVYRTGANNYLYGNEVSVYAEDNFDIGHRISVNAGIHLSLFRTQGKTYFSPQPRLSARYRFDHGFSAKLSYSQMAQYVHLLSSTPLSMPTDLWVPITKNIRPMRASQYAIGGYYDGLRGWEFSIEGYYKQMRNVLEYQDGVSFFGSSTNWEEKVEMGEGRSMGVEFMAQRTLGRTTGWMAYTLAKSDRQFKDGSINNGERFPYKYDRRHNVSICLNHKFSSRVDIGASWVFSSGGTATIPDQQTVVLTPDGEVKQANHIAQRNNYRLPASHRLNIGVNFNKKTKHGIRTWNISLYNAYNSMNPTLIYTEKVGGYSSYYQDYYYGTKPEERIVIKKLTLLPIIPSVTYTYRF